jgi:hypothetical protein
MSNKEVVVLEKPAVKKGRPSKARLKEASKKLGRPREDSGRIAEFKQRLLATSGDKVIDKIVQLALEDGNPAQVACLKMCIDRVLPLSLFEKDAKGQRNAVTINITGIGEVTAVQDAEVIDMDEEDNDIH